MRTMRGLVRQAGRHEGRIGRVWRRISQAAAPMLPKRGVSSQLYLTRCAPGMTDKMGKRNHSNTSLHRKGGAA